ncbi:MAG TPA: aminopeptidase P N-terminal domain-containing protein, partial [Accumulibacter sp.]|nr:aminopeptidase P N-terminal domain-containing protein [Accumulibacter sp.]
MTVDAHIQRRRQVLAQIEDGVAIIPTAPERLRNRDTHYPYRFDSYFWYLSGFPEPEAVIVLLGGENPKDLLFCREKDPEREIWDGFRHGPDAAAEKFGFAEACPLATLEKRLPELLANRRMLWHALGYDRRWDRRLTDALNAVRAQSRSGTRAPSEIRDLRALLDGMRLIKDADELALMRQAAAITDRGHRRAMQRCRPGMSEYQLEAEISYEFRRLGADSHAYPPIVAGGANACILHYVDNDRPLNDGDLVLIDAGCERSGYAADVTRTWPVSGRFSGVQREVYEIVLAAQSAAIAALRPGVSFITYHQAALRVLTQGLIDLRVLTGDIDELIANQAYQPWYMHRTGHWLGLDVHDAGDYRTGDGADDWTPLAPGMVLTVEPGLYFRAAAETPAQLHGIGIRIEDDVLLTEDGCQVYTAAPKTIAEIEET